MQCGVEKRMIRKKEVIVVECLKCGEKWHKCKECPLWRKMKEEKRLRRIVEEEVVCVARPKKVQQKGKLACPIRKEAQEAERKLRRVEESKATRMTKP